MGESGQSHARFGRVRRGDDGRERPRRIVFPGRPRIDRARHETSGRAFRRALHNHANPPRWRQQDVAFPNNAISRHPVLVNRHTIERDHPHHLRLVVHQHLQIEIRDRRRIQHAPELLFSRPNLNDARGIRRVGYWDEIDREIFRRRAAAGICAQDVAFIIAKNQRGRHRTCRHGCCVRIQQALIADHKDSLRQPRQHRIGPFNPFHDQRSRRSSLHLHVGESVNVRVIPVESRRLVERHAEPVLKRPATGLYECIKHIVLVAHGRHRQSVKVHVR